MEHIITGYLRQVWETSGWLYEDQHGFIPRYSCESKVVTVCQYIAGSLDEGVRKDAIIIDFSNGFDFVQYDKLRRKIAESGVDWKLVVW